MKIIRMLVGVIGIAALVVGCSTEQPLTTQDANSIKNTVRPEDRDGNNNAPAKAISTLSLANSYETLDELAEVSKLISEVQIVGVHSTNKEKDTTFYNAILVDVLKGPSEEKNIVIAQIGIEEEKERLGLLEVKRDNPLMQQEDSYILFLKQGNDDELGAVYYVAGEYQGKYEIRSQQVFSVNQEEKTQATVTGESLDQFKEKIRKLL